MESGWILIKVSAIVSVYKASRFLRGRLDDLLAQSLTKRKELEIIVVNAGNEEGEDRIIRDAIAADAPITYIRTLREPIYYSWNRAIRLAQGEYITNANVDDRLRPDALEVMAAALDDNPSVSLVYADAIVTSTPNATWGGTYEVSQKPPYYGKLAWPEADPALLLKSYYGGPNPMFRHSLNSQYGYFDDSYQLAGDYEWMLRLAAHNVQFLHIKQALTLFYDDGIGMGNIEHSGMEARRALLRWGRYLNG